MTLFNGLDRAYGTYRITGTEGNKQVGEAVTTTGHVNEDLWEAHLTGRQGIGIIPIRDNSSCSFGAIDVDKYSGIDYVKIIVNIRKKKYPLIPCLSKSKGLHLYLFSSKSVDAAAMRATLRTMAATLGFGSSEIFPKQDVVLAEKGDFGSWINMPYFDEKKTTRHALSDKGEKLSLPEFLDLADKHKVDLNAYKLPNVSSGDLDDGPPCLQYLVMNNEIVEGMRNEAMFNLAVYLKRALPDSWETRFTKENERLKPPLSRQELVSICKSVKRKEYFYACSRPPLNQFCDRGVCRNRKFGIGIEGDFPLLTNLTKYATRPPIWFVDVEGGGRLELMTEDLQNQVRFQRCCMECLNRMPPVVKPEQWRSLVQSLMEKMTIIDVPIDASTVGQFWLHLESFCSARAQAKSKEEILIGKPWLDNGRHHFRLSDFMDYLERKKFREFKVNKAAQMIRDRGGTHSFIRLHDKGVNIWSVPEFERRTDKQLTGYESDGKEPI